jgi:ubiquinone/menaquinone biosynthesis C-methylase UbiE
MDSENSLTSVHPYAAGWRKRLHAWMLSHSSAKYDHAVSPYKQRLLGTLTGDVLEIGPGAGANLPHFALGIRWVGVEPNPYMVKYLRKTALGLGRVIDLRLGRAESLEFRDGSFDAVVSTLVLCSVRDQAKALDEIKRVLRPGGRFVFIEHVAAPEGSPTRRRQEWIRPLWKAIGDGCHPDRETWRAIEAAGFEHVKIEHFRVPFPIIGPHIAGVALAPA